MPSDTSSLTMQGQEREAAESDLVNMFGIKRFRTQRFDNDDESVDVDSAVTDSPAMDKLSKFIFDSLEELKR